LTGCKGEILTSVGWKVTLREELS